MGSRPFLDMQDHHSLYRPSNTGSVFLAGQYVYLACLGSILHRIYLGSAAIKPFGLQTIPMP